MSTAPLRSLSKSQARGSKCGHISVDSHSCAGYRTARLVWIGWPSVTCREWYCVACNFSTFLNIDWPLCKTAVIMPCFGSTNLSISAPKARQSDWKPRQIPKTGNTSSSRSFQSSFMSPTSLSQTAHPGPGPATTASKSCAYWANVDLTRDLLLEKRESSMKILVTVASVFCSMRATILFENESYASKKRIRRGA
jgi:hypothetical protein